MDSGQCRLRRCLKTALFLPISLRSGLWLALYRPDYAPEVISANLQTSTGTPSEREFRGVCLIAKKRNFHKMRVTFHTLNPVKNVGEKWLGGRFAVVKKEPPGHENLE